MVEIIVETVRTVSTFFVYNELRVFICFRQLK